jgi:hypothetical protein
MQNSEIQFIVHRIHHVHTHEIIFITFFKIFLHVLNCFLLYLVSFLLCSVLLSFRKFSFVKLYDEALFINPLLTYIH